ncbi:MAG: DNA polymerase III subunit alpha, partial [bacterium]
DHGNMFGMVKFYQQAHEKGIHPIIGCELYLAPRRMVDKEHPIDKPLTHLILLAENQTGYHNLIRLVSESYIRGFYYKPRIDKEILAELSDGLIALSSCQQGEIPSLLLKGQQKKAKKTAEWYLETFGENNFFIEIMNHGLEEQQKLIPLLIEFVEETSIPLVVSNDVHYINPEEHLTQEVLMSIEQGRILEDEKRLSFKSKEFYLKSLEEMSKLFPKYDDALTLTAEIAQRCNVELEIEKTFLPKFDVPGGKSPDEFLEELTWDGISKKYPAVHEGIRERVNFELEVIKKMGFSPYFLIVWDLITFARRNEIPVGPGRGSAAGSIVAYALDITKIDPLKYDLLFERFLNPERVSMPDFDIDFCYERRSEIINYAIKKYGEDHVCQIITFGREKARNAIRDVGRVMGIPLPTVDRIAKLVPFIMPDGKSVTIQGALGAIDELQHLHRTDETIRRLLEISAKIEGHPRNISTHAAGIVISRDPLTNHIPLYKSTRDESILTQLVHEDLEKLGLMKMDILGLRNLTVIADTVRYIHERTGEKIDVDSLPLNDKKTFHLFSRGDTDGVFQFEGPNIKNLLRRVRPTCIEDLIALNALNRPGPLGGGMVDEFIKNRQTSTHQIPVLLPSLEPILRDTYGIILYQEQVMRIANVVGGLTLAQADLMRRAMGKKIPKEMEKLKGTFLSGAAEKKIPPKTADKIFSLMAEFAGYGFNKSHSAAYAYLAYQTAYLKANYPVEFMAALLTSLKGDTAKIAKYIDDCRQMNIEVMLPDINVGYKIFAPVENRIYYGLAAIKNVGEGAIDAIVAAREKGGGFRSLLDFCQRVDMKTVNIKTLESLIRAGALDSLPGYRAQKMAVLDKTAEISRSSQRDRDAGQILLFDTLKDEAAVGDIQLPDIPEFDIKQLLADEKELLGLYLSHHPLDPYRNWVKTKADTTAADLASVDPTERKKVAVAGIITRFREYPSKSGSSMWAIIELEDFTGKIIVRFYERERERYIEELEVDNIVAVTGRVLMRHREISEEDVVIEPSIVCDELASYRGMKKKIKSQPQPPNKLHIRIIPSTENDEGRNLIEEMKHLVRSNRGSTAVIVHISENNEGEKKIRLRDHNIHFSPEFIHIARRIFGENNVWTE